MILPFLCFYGRTQEAVTYYQSVFGFEQPHFLLFAQVPNRGFEVPETLNDGVMFTEFTVSQTRVMACDAYPGLPGVPGQSVSLNIIETDEDKLRQWFEALAQDGQIGMPLQPTLWAPLYASVTDRFGIIWQLSLNR